MLMTRRFSILAVFTLMLAAGAVLLGTQPRGSDLIGAAYAQDATADEIDTSMIKEMSIGNPDSSVTVIEYASYTCPHCAAFHADTFKQLKADYIDTGKINFVYREVYFDRFGLWAGIVARCGENGSLTIPEISRAEGLSVPNVAKLMRLLRMGGLVQSARGQSGGYSAPRQTRRSDRPDARRSAAGPAAKPARRDLCRSADRVDHPPRS